MIYMKKDRYSLNNRYLITAVAVVILASLFLATKGTELIGKATDGTASEDTQSSLSRYIFYNTPRVFSDPEYSSTCFPRGEVMQVIPGNSCCEGLVSIGIVDEAQEGCNFVLGAVLCSDCGNSLCEFGENNCNCPEDCNLPAPQA